MRAIVLPALCLALPACAELHRTQLGDIEPAGKGKHITVKVSEDTVDLAEIGKIAKAAGRAFRSQGAKNVGKGFETYTELFQMGPRTGTPVYNELYARFVPEMLREQCPQGRLANVLSVRESRNYPVVKGEIVRIEADCMP